MDKKYRKKQANHTLDIFDKGYYEIGGNKISIKELDEQSVESVLLIHENANSTKMPLIKKHQKPAYIEIKNISVVDAIINSKEIVGVLNFASAYHSGGGFLNGAMAQEESLCYASNLYYLQTEFENGFYNYNKRIKSKCYSDRMIYSPNVVFIKDSNFELLNKPVLANILTVPAINLGASINNGEDEQICKMIMKDRMRKILSVLYCYGNEIIILGAFGCGVFKNNPEDVAQYWKELLFDEGWCYCFKKVVFAIYETSHETKMIDIFKKYF